MSDAASSGQRKTLKLAAEIRISMPLTYDIAAERLFGSVGRQYFDMRAVSGGGRGRKIGLPSHSLSSYLSTTGENSPKGERGGPLPGGDYKCEYLPNHPPFHECIHLRLLTSHQHLVLSKVGGHRGLDSFYIHGRGPKGSDGCIVPLDNADRLRLNLAVKDNPGTYLRVINARYALPATRDDIQIA
jgi:hypothetical protein